MAAGWREQAPQMSPAPLPNQLRAAGTHSVMATCLRSTALGNTAQHSTAQPQHSSAHHSTGNCWTAQPSPAVGSLAQHSTSLAQGIPRGCSAPQHRKGQNTEQESPAIWWCKTHQLATMESNVNKCQIAYDEAMTAEAMVKHANVFKEHSTQL